MTVLTPSQEGAVKGPNVHEDLTVPEVWTAVCAPLRLTHFVSFAVFTVSVIA